MSNTSNKVEVGIIYSDGPHTSLESVHLAKYLGAHLVATGWAVATLIGFQAGNSSVSALCNDRISYYPIGKSKPIQAPSSDLSYGHWCKLGQCHVIFVCVNSEDCEACGKKIVEMVSSNLAITLFCMSRGVRGGSEFKEVVSGKKGFTVIETVIGFAVVPHPTTGALVSTTHATGKNCIVVERLTKEMVKTSDGAVNLLETIPFTYLFQKTLTTSSWGLLQLDTLAALQTVLWAESSARGATGNNTIAECAQNSNFRMVCAAMIRESSEALLAAAAGGNWKPDLRPISNLITPWLLEMMLVLPTPIFYCVVMLTGLPLPPLPSTGVVDVVAKRSCYLRHHLKELVDSGEKHHASMPLCAHILAKLDLINSPAGTATLIKGNVLLEAKQIIGKSSSAAEVMYWVTRTATVFCFVVVMYFLFLH
mmetsp:Transcript_24897/g.36716  ORF Transcript_24897/g.36716 Transcript_24897/m.36716 type:complete len:422 (-) Transcript_24897:140-1405(-)